MRIFVDLVIINNTQNRIMDEIVKELHTLKLSGMARLWASLGETKRLDKLTLVDGLMLLLQAERDTRTTNRNTRLVKEADFRYSSTLEQLQASSHRGIDPAKHSACTILPLPPTSNKLTCILKTASGKWYS